MISKKYFKIILKNWFFLPFIIILGLVQATFLDYINVFNARPDLLLVAAIIISIFLKSNWAIFFSVFAGILKDVLSINVFGVNTLLFPLWSFLIIRLSKEISVDNELIPAVYIFVIVAISDTIAILVLLFLGRLVYWGIFLRTVFINSLYTALVLPLVFKIVRPALKLIRKPLRNYF